MKKERIIASIIFIILFLVSCGPKSIEDTQTSQKAFKWLEYDIESIQEAYKNGEVSVEELVGDYIQRIMDIDQEGPELNSVIRINPDALDIAKRLDSTLQAKTEMGPLFGIPILLKDNIDTGDKMPCTAGSRALKDSYPPDDAFLVKKLREAGAVILGKANLSEWANFRGELSSSGWSGILGQTKNPYVLDRNPCGSSSGSGVSVSANLTVLAIGTETNGSIVCPSNNNGIVGIKPTVGLVSRSGIIPISFTQDTGGPMARSVRDAVICLGAMTGVDSMDSKTIDSGQHALNDYSSYLNTEGLNGKKLGIYKGPLNTSFRVDTLFYQAVALMKEQGAEVIELENIYESHIGGLSFQIMLYEYKDGLNKYFASLGVGAKIKNLEELIAFNQNDSFELINYDQRYLKMAQEKDGVDSEDYKNTLAKMLRGIREEGIDRVMDEYKLDAIIAPTGSPAWKTDLINGDNYIMSSSSPAAMAGYPNITVPMGFVDNLPVNISFFGRAWSEGKLIELAYAYEQESKHRRPPNFLSGDQ